MSRGRNRRSHGPDTEVQDQFLHRSHRACNTRPVHTDRFLVSPGFFLGKGLGDLPHSLAFAVTGAVVGEVNMPFRYQRRP